MANVAKLAAEIERRMAEEIPADAPDGAAQEWLVANYGHLPVGVFREVVEFLSDAEEPEGEPTPAQVDAIIEAHELLKARGLANDPEANFMEALQKVADEGDEQARYLIEVISEVESILVPGVRLNG
jgi:hypothetical protein